MENLPPPKFVPPKNYPPPKIFWFKWFVQILLFGKSWCFLSDLNSKIFTPGVKFFEFDNKYIIRCLLLKYRLIFLLVFLYLTRLKARQILSRLVKNISLYFKRRHLIIYNYFQAQNSFPKEWYGVSKANFLFYFIADAIVFAKVLVFFSPFSGTDKVLWLA